MNIENTTWTAIIKQQAILEALINNGEEDFSQASHSLCKWPGSWYPWSLWIQQSLSTDSMWWVWHWLHLQQHPTSLNHQGRIPLWPSQPHQSLQHGILYIKERTSSNPKGLHHGKWKALIKDNDTFKPYALMIMFAFKYGKSPDIWTNSHQIILGKDTLGKLIKINQIHQIQLVCAAMNMGCRIIWGHEMLKCAVQKGQVSPYQFGGINERMAISSVLLKWISYNIFWLCDSQPSPLTMMQKQHMTKWCHPNVWYSPHELESVQAQSRWNSQYSKEWSISSKWPMELCKTISRISSSRKSTECSKAVLRYVRYGPWAPPYSLRFLRNSSQWQSSPQPAIYTARNGEGFIDDVTLWETLLTAELRVVLASMQAKAWSWEWGVHIARGALNLLKTI